MVLVGEYVFFFNDTPTTEIYTLSLHDALPICRRTSSASRSKPRDPITANSLSIRSMYASFSRGGRPRKNGYTRSAGLPTRRDRKSTRLNSSHANISYAVFCLKKQTSNAVSDLQ